MKKMLALALGCIIATGSVVTGFAQQSEEDISVVSEEVENDIGENTNEISEKDAELVAKQFILSRSKAPGLTETFPENFTLEKNITMYDLSDTPSAYKFDVLDENGSYSGYIVIGAQKCYHPVVEFSCSDEESIFDIAENKARNANKMYYVGGIDYLVENEANEFVDFDGQNIGTYSEIEGTLKRARSSENEFEDEWNDILERANNDPGLKDPTDFEKNWDDFDGQELYDYNRVRYCAQEDFPGEKYKGCCSTIATLNAFLYCEKIYGMSILKLDNNWTKTFDRIAELSGATYNQGASGSKLLYAIETFLDEIGTSRLHCSLYSSSKFNSNSVRNNMINDKLQILNLSRNELYGDHYVFVVAYENYIYNNKPDSVYLGVLDGKVKAIRYLPYNNSITELVTLYC